MFSTGIKAFFYFVNYTLYNRCTFFFIYIYIFSPMFDTDIKTKWLADLLH